MTPASKLSKTSHLERSALHDLADAHGVATEFENWRGEMVAVSEQTIRAVLVALGVAAADEAEVAQSLIEAEQAPWLRALPASVVCREHESVTVLAHVPHGADVRLVIEGEDGWRAVVGGGSVTASREVGGSVRDEVSFELPTDLPLGWHSLVLSTDTSGDESEVGGDGEGGHVGKRSSLIVVPSRLPSPAVTGAAGRGESAGGGVLGLTTQIYQVRSAGSWGIGDCADLAALVTHAGREWAADFVVINPVHAAEPVPPMEPSPYLPTTRRFVNPIYVRPEGIPEFGRVRPEAGAAIAELAKRAQRLNRVDTIDRDTVWALKREALELIYAAGLDEVRGQQFEVFCRERAAGLERFATWCVLAEEHGADWSRWPRDVQDPDDPAVGEFAQVHADRVRFYQWLQWVVQEQFRAVQQAARDVGMSIGIMHDLAVGVHPSGADAWALHDVLVRGASVGAPPDQFNQLGQDWSQPPWHPQRLAEQGYAPFRDMVQAVLRDAGGVRIDHIIGLFRLWWVPSGGSAAEGTYVAYDHEALIGILCLEAQRAGAVVVGEDLGTVPRHARAALHDAGILGTNIVWFELDDGTPIAPEDYRDVALASVTTHDMPPTAGYLALDHVTLRHELGLLTRPVEQERADEEVTMRAMRAALHSRDLIRLDASIPEVVIGMHRWLAHTPSMLRSASLADAVGDRRTVNQPGTRDEYPNWRVPLTGPDGTLLSLEDALASPHASAVMRAARDG